MKKKSILLLSLVAFSLLGCNEVKSSDTTTPSSSSPSTEKSESTGAVSTASTPISQDTTSDVDSSSSSESTSESTSEDVTALWPDTVKDSMREHLGGQVVPYVNMGLSPSKINTPTWEVGTSTLTVMGGVIDTGLTETQLSDAKDIYEKASWTATVDNGVMTAVNAAGDITVKYYADDGIVYLDCTYKEVFDPDAASAFPADLIAEMNTYLGNHASDVPYVYLGTANPQGTVGEGTYTITGGEWNDDIILLATTAYSKANKLIADEAYRWSCYSSSESNTSYFIATVTLSDGTKLKVTITSERLSEYSTRMLAKMIIAYTPPFVPTDTGSWRKDISNVFTNTFDGHAIPWFYTGSEAYLNYSSDSVATIQGTTGTWDDQIFTLAKAAVDKENESITVDANKWTYTSSDNGSSSGLAMWTFTRTCEDGCILKFTVENYSTNENYGNKALIYVYYTKKYSAPINSGWSDDTKAAIKTYLDDAEIPYVYLGTTSETAAWDKSSSTLTITGSTFYETVLNGAASVFTSAAGWTSDGVKTVTEEGLWGSVLTYKNFVATKVVDATLGSKLIVTVDSSAHYTNGQGGNCVMKIKYEKPYTVPTGVTDWDDDIVKPFLKEHLAGHTIPWIYLNMDSADITTGYSKWTGTYLVGGDWDTGIITHATTQLTADKWSDITPNSDNTSLTASKTEDDGCYISLRLYKTNMGKARIDLYFTEAFSTLTTSWDDSVIADMKTCLNNNVIPFVQLGSPNLTTSPNKKKNYITIYSTVWSDTATSAAKTALADAGWETLMNEYDSDYKDQLNAFKINDDGSALYLCLRDTGGAELNVYYFAAETLAADKKSDWSDDEKTYLNKLTDSHASYVPYIYMGEGSYTLGTDDDVITGTLLSPISVLKYYTTLKAAGYTKFGFKVSNSATKLMAGYTDSDSNEVYLEVGNGYDNSGNKVNSLTVSFKSVYNPPSAENSKWSDTVTSKITEALGEGETLPYVYLGSSNPKAKLTTSGDESVLDIYSNAWNDAIVDSAYTAFSSSSDGWTVVKDLYDNQVIASRKTTGGKILKVVVYKEVSSESSLEAAHLKVFIK